ITSNAIHNQAIIRTTTRISLTSASPKRILLLSSCPDGQKPLLFPSTNLPLACDRTRLCPHGFVCTDRKCCPLERQRRSLEMLCPRGYRLLV
ncbi:hypothetical protein V3C99_001398, partial [Haemonchus contortus]